MRLYILCVLIISQFLSAQTMNPALIKKIQELNKKQYEDKLKTSLNKKSSIQDESIVNKASDLSLSSDDLVNQLPNEIIREADKFFGESFFKNIISIPKTYGPVPDSYKLGPGDQLIITLYGANQISHELTIDRDNNIFPDVVGRIALSNITFLEAKELIKQKYSKHYSTLKGSNPKTKLFVSLGEHRKVHVTVIGEVNYPRQVILSSINTIFDAVVLAGGPTEHAAIRKVAIRRANKIYYYDLYQDIVVPLSGQQFYLEDGDIINLTAEKESVEISGGVRRENVYEINKKSNVFELVTIAGGLKYNASLDFITILTIEGDVEKAIVLQSEAEMKTYLLKEQDKILVHERVIDSQSYVEIKGSIMYPGKYAFNSGKKIKFFIDNAGGLKKDTFTKRVDLLRKLNNKEYASYTYNYEDINKIEVLDGDIITFYNKIEFIEERVVHIYSFAQGRFTFPYYQESDIYDYLSMIGGIKYNEDESFVEIVRLSEANKDNYATLYNVALNKNYLEKNADKEKDFLLRPDDNIIIRRNPNFESSYSVKILGEVVSAGSFTITKRDEKISDLLIRAKGLKQSAYIDGIQFFRKKTENFKVLDKIKVSSDNYNFSTKEFVENANLKETPVEEATHIRIPLDFVDILDNLNSEDNLYLVDEDSIVVTRNPFTVIVEGEVNSPIPVIFEEGKSVEFYIEQAGGLTEFGDDTRIQVIKANGKHYKSGFFSNDKINAGTVIRVPAKISADNTNEILTTIATSLSTIITMFVLIQQL